MEHGAGPNLGRFALFGNVPVQERGPRQNTPQISIAVLSARIAISRRVEA